MHLYGLFILDVNIKYIVFSILYRHINVPMACKELSTIGTETSCSTLQKHVGYFAILRVKNNPHVFAVVHAHNLNFKINPHVIVECIHKNVRVVFDP